jgi:tripartite-type tricarboxylate transporter receptor subunit TctC
VTPAKRVPALPDTPTFAEAGVKGLVVVNWYGLISPKGTPKPVIDVLNREVVKAMQSPDMAKRLLAEGSSAVGSSPQEFAAHIRAEHDMWAKVIKQAGIRGQ